MKTFSMIASVSMLALVFGLAGCKSNGSGSEEVILSSETKACSDCSGGSCGDKASCCGTCGGGDKAATSCCGTCGGDHGHQH